MTGSDLIERIVSALAALADQLERDDRLASLVGSESGLHPTAVRHSLVAWATGITADAMTRLVGSRQRSGPRTRAGRLLTLAPGNVPIVAAECLLLGILAGVEHDLMLSTRSTALAGGLLELLRTAGAESTAGVRLETWRSLSPSQRGARLARAQRVVAYGTAETVEWLAERVPSGVPVVPHGPSVALAYVDVAEVDGTALSEALSTLALDVAHYDQRGCRSPHALIVRGPPGLARAAAEELFERALPDAEARLPRGSLSDAERCDLYLDSLTSESLGTVYRGAAWGVTLEQDPRVLRPSPLGRTLRVVSLDRPDRLGSLLATLPAPIGCLATHDGRPVLRTAGIDIPETVPIGELQKPPFDRLHDGRHRLDELT